jgi:hypothetical protein
MYCESFSTPPPYIARHSLISIERGPGAWITAGVFLFLYYRQTGRLTKPLFYMRLPIQFIFLQMNSHDPVSHGRNGAVCAVENAFPVNTPHKWGRL